MEDHEARAESCPAAGAHDSGCLGFERVGEGKVARLERGDQPNSKSNDEANGPAQPEHTAVDLILQMKLKLVAEIQLRFVLAEKRAQAKICNTNAWFWLLCAD